MVYGLHKLHTIQIHLGGGGSPRISTQKTSSPTLKYGKQIDIYYIQDIHANCTGFPLPHPTPKKILYETLQVPVQAIQTHEKNYTKSRAAKVYLHRLEI